MEFASRSKSRTRTVINLFIILFFVVSVIVPIATMLSNISSVGIGKLAASGQFVAAMKNSVTTALCSTVISIVLALAAALCIERTNIRGKELFSFIFVVPMLIPSISHAFGIVALFGTNGMITNLFNLSGSVYGFTGIVLGSVMYSFPVVFLMISSSLHYEDCLPYRAAQVMGIPAWRTFFDVTLPYLKRTLISAFFAVFSMIVTDYGVPLLIGGKTVTLSTLMYNKTVAMLDYDSGSVVGACLLIPAIIAFLVDLLSEDTVQSAFVTDHVQMERSKTTNAAAYVFSLLITLFVLAPIAAFCMMTFETKYPVDPTFTLYHIIKTLNRGAGGFLLNSCVYSLLTAAVGTALAFCCAYMTARMSGKSGKVVHLLAMTTMAIPGLVLGLSYVLFFNGSFLYGTMGIIVLVNSIHFFSSPYLMIYNAMAKLNPNLEAVGLSLGVKRIRIIFDVILPKVKYTITEMAVYFFVNSMMTISAVSFLAPPSPKPIALMINQFESQLLMESAAFVSVLILVINLTVKIIMYFVKKSGGKQNDAENPDPDAV